METRCFIKGKVSIVTPVYNGEKYLHRFLDSVLGQTYIDIELILVDDGSTDRTLIIAGQYREAFRHKGYEFRIIKAEHKNASGAMNEGLPYVTGEYLIWPDSDDVLEPESVERRVDFLQNNPEYECVRSLSYYFDDKTGQPARPDERKGSLKKEDLFWDILEAKTFVCCGCYMLKSEKFFQIYSNKRIPEYDIGQNFQMLLPYLYFYKCYTIPRELYGVAVRSGSHSRTPLTKEQEEKKFKNYEKLGDEIAEICQLDQEERERLFLWKIERRYWLAEKYKDKKMASSCMIHLFKKRKMGFVQLVKRVIWLYVENKWVKEFLYHCNWYVYKVITGFQYLTGNYAYYKNNQAGKESCKLKNKNFTIISNNCWGGFIYQKYGIEYQTPTIGLTMSGHDYVKFCENLAYYLDVPLAFIPWEQGSLYEEWKGRDPFPIGKLEDIEVYFMHYSSEKEAREKWERRKQRIQPDHMLFKLSQRGQCSKEDVIRFVNMPYKNKICFAYDKVPGTIYVPELETIRGDEFALLEKYFDEVPVLDSL